MNALTFQAPETGIDPTLLTLVVLGVLLIYTLLFALWYRERMLRKSGSHAAEKPAKPQPAPAAAPPPTAAAQPPAAARPAAAVAPVPAQTGPYIEFEGVQGGTRRFYIGGGPLNIGRTLGSDVCITETMAGWETVSRAHARIVRETVNGQTRTLIEDLKSHNGVFVNGRRTGRNVLRDGWRVSIGRLTFTYRTNESAAAHERRSAA
jgi:hypothetical protein